MPCGAQRTPFDGAGGAVLQRWATETGAGRFSAAPRKVIEAFDELVADMRALWSNREAVGARVAEVRRAALAGIAPAEGRGREIAIDRICADMRNHREGDVHLCLYLEYAGCDEALRLGKILEFVPGREVLDDRGLWRIPFTHEHRLEDLEVLRAIARTAGSRRSPPKSSGWCRKGTRRRSVASRSTWGRTW